MAANMLDCKESSLVWTDGHLPLETVDEVSEGWAEVDRLEHQVARLEQELDKERRSNQQVCQQIGATRARNDEWVAMMCILRQETEAVLHRHNTILQSDVALHAAQRLSEQQPAPPLAAALPTTGGEASEDAADADMEATVKKNGKVSTEAANATEDDDGAPAAKTTQPKTTAADEANEGDDERSINNEEEEEDWNNNNNNNTAAGSKRAADDSDGTSRGKRRRT